MVQCGIKVSALADMDEMSTLAWDPPASAASRHRHCVTLRACLSPAKMALVMQWLLPFRTVIRVSGITAPAAISMAFSVAKPAGSKAKLAGTCSQSTGHKVFPSSATLDQRMVAMSPSSSHLRPS